MAVTSSLPAGGTDPELKGWFDTALTVASTIGRVAGALSGAGGGVFHMGPRGSGPFPTLGQVVFIKGADGQLYAWNQSPSDDAGLFFPGDSTNEGCASQIYLPATGPKFPIGLTFQKFATRDLDNFTMQNLPSANTAAGGGENAGPDINLSAQAYQPIPPNVEVAIGPNFTVTVKASERVILVGVAGALTLTVLTLVNARAGNTAIRIINALRRPSAGNSDDPQHISVDVPAGPDLTSGLTGIDIEASVGNLTTVVAEFVRANAEIFVPVTEEDRANLAAAAAAAA